MLITLNDFVILHSIKLENGLIFSGKSEEIFLYDFKREKVLEYPFESYDVNLNNKDDVWIKWIKSPNQHICSYRLINMKIVEKAYENQTVFDDVECSSEGNVKLLDFNLHHLGIWMVYMYLGTTLIKVHENIIFYLTDSEFQISVNNNFDLIKPKFFQVNEPSPISNRWKELLGNYSDYKKAEEYNNELVKWRENFISVKIHPFYNYRLYFCCSIILHCGENALDCYMRLNIKFDLLLKNSDAYEIGILESSTDQYHAVNYNKYLKIGIGTVRPILLYRKVVAYDPYYYKSREPKTQKATDKHVMQCFIYITHQTLQRNLHNFILYFNNIIHVSRQEMDLKFVAAYSKDSLIQPIIANIQQEQFGTSLLYRKSVRHVDKLSMESVSVKDYYVRSAFEEPGYFTIQMERILLLSELDQTRNIRNEYKKLSNFTFQMSERRITNKKKKKDNMKIEMLLVFTPLILILTFGLMIISTFVSVGNKEAVETLESSLSDESLYVIRSSKLSSALRRESSQIQRDSIMQ
ncbi:hypothetical protein SNEBB_007273 [Seison nebaliae]|nr:hypothetical protein SNEBB_007273 [Seison nebaliae]